MLVHIVTIKTQAEKEIFKITTIMNASPPVLPIQSFYQSSERKIDMSIRFAMSDRA